MSRSLIRLENLQGLSEEQVSGLRLQFGRNVFHAESSHRYMHIVWAIIKEPMFILLIIACLLYFILGEVSEGIMMLVAMVLVAAISLYQEVKSTNAIKALEQFAEPKVTVVREGKEVTIASEELVPGDLVILEEGMNVPADAVILQANDCSVNESVITGESLPADKDETTNKLLYQGTTINGGKCIAQVSVTGNNTVLGKLGISVGTYQTSRTLLQQQISRFVNRLAFFGLVGFFIIFIVNFLNGQPWAASLLFALTLAMSAVPEEIPVAFSSFMALGAYKMSRLGIISRHPYVVENLGAVSVICLDKTGTITENKMQVKAIYDYKRDKITELNNNSGSDLENVLHYGMLASEASPFDAMEKAILEAWHLNIAGKEQQQLKMIHEYPLQGQPPMMTHVYAFENTKIVAAKGATERIVRVCKPGDNATNIINGHTRSFALKGYRVIAVASATHDESIFPDMQDNFKWKFEGLIALYDPPKENIQSVLQQFYDAKINVKMLTGDYPETAMNIAKQVGMNNYQTYFTGEQIVTMPEPELKKAVNTTSIFARMFPDAKLKVIDALKANNEIVAMTGDGVNDGPALKSANIGIAMGKRGTEIARQASDLVLTNDDLESMVNAIREGRKIFSNLKKAVRYIISIHIPIILTASLPVIFAWRFPNIFTPIHVIFLELIMGPTCSVYFEKEPVEENLMKQGPRLRNAGLFRGSELLISIIQGIIIAAGALVLYYYFMNIGASLAKTRTIVFTSLILSNVFLTFANRSFSRNFYYTSRYKNSLTPVILIISAVFLLTLHLVPFVRNLFQITVITPREFWLCAGVSFTSVIWFEIYKTWKGNDAKQK